MNFIEDLGINGHLQIIKLHKDGKEETVFDDHNIIVSGMGVGLALLFAGLGSTSITNYQIDRVQLGTGTQTEASTVNALNTALTATAQYGTDADLYTVTGNQFVGATVQTNKVFLKIPHSKVTRINDNSVRYTIVLDDEACNSLTLTEIGLFMKNPTGAASDTSLLVAYRTYSSIAKTSDFSLIFRWTLNF